MPPAGDFTLASAAPLHAMLQEGIVDRNVKFTPVLDGYRMPEYIDWELQPFSNHKVMHTHCLLLMPRSRDLFFAGAIMKSIHNIAEIFARARYAKSTAHMLHHISEVFYHSIEHVVCSLFGRTAYIKDLTEPSGNLVRQLLADSCVALVVCKN